ncbi:MAG: LacI family transcriptional regulator [Firmicutes bacterium]|nr:LacI family transcriptional regulator [Bacillota bacterium]
MATIKDVARAAGVSPSTVSRVLAGHPRISQATRERVLQAMQELNYHPNAIARSLVTRTSRTIGLITSRPTEQAFANPFFPEVIRGIGSVLEEEGYNLLLATTHGEDDDYEACMRLFRGRQVDGVILTSSRLGDRLIAALVAEEQPFVLIGRPLDAEGRPVYSEAHWVNNDNVAAAQTAVEHLLSLGHRRIGFVNGPPHWVFTYDRLEGYRTALARAGIAYDPDLVLSGHITQQDGGRALERLLSLPDPPTAIVAVDDTLALGVLDAALRRGLRVPEDLAVVGFNDDPITAWTRPTLTTVRIPVFELGVMAARMLVSILRGQPVRPRQVILPCQLIVRASTVGEGRAGANV